MGSAELSGMLTHLGAEMEVMLMFSNGRVDWFETTENDGEGVFLKPPPEDADEDAELELVSNIEDALPPGWEPVGGSN